MLSRISRSVQKLSSSLERRCLSVATHAVQLEDSTGDARFLRHGSPMPQLHDLSDILHFPETRISTLPNGIRVVTQTTPSVQTATVGVWIDSGSRFETSETNGTAHFLEHMIFKGTRRRSAHSLEVEIENMGGRLNAYTSREQTTFYANVLQDDVPVALDILADILQNSRFAANAIARERNVILREMEEVHKQAEEVIFDHLHSVAFRNHPLGNTILGPSENIQNISKKDLQAYISRHYTGSRMVISAAGAVSHHEITGLVDRLFNKLPVGETTAVQLVKETPALFSPSEIRMARDDIPSAHLIIAFQGASWTDPFSIPLMVIQSLLGSWNKSSTVGNFCGSELAKKVSINNLVENIMAFNTNYCDTGLFGIYATSMPNCLFDLSVAVMQSVQRLVTEVSEDEVRRTCSQLKSALLLHIDGTSAVAENNGRQLLTYGRIMPFLELFARIDAVDAATVKDVAQKFIINKDVAVAAMGPIYQMPDYKWFCSQIQSIVC